MNIPVICDVSAVPHGKIFYLPLPSGGNALCVSGYVESENVKYNYTIPLYWHGQPKFTLDPFETSNLRGNAVIVDEAWVYVDPANACESTDICFVAGNDLYLRLRSQESSRGQLLNTATGKISAVAEPSKSGFSRWSVVGAIKQERDLLFAYPRETSAE